MHPDEKGPDALTALLKRAALVGTWIWNVEDRQLSWSDELCEIFGYESGSEPTLERLYAAVHPDDVSRVRSVARAAASGVVDRIYFRVARKSCRTVAIWSMGADAQPPPLLRSHAAATSTLRPRRRAP